MIKEIPNCDACKWGYFYHDSAHCRAQAFKEAVDVYNKKLCKKLYEKKAEKYMTYKEIEG